MSSLFLKGVKRDWDCQATKKNSIGNPVQMDCFPRAKIKLALLAIPLSLIEPKIHGNSIHIDLSQNIP